VLPRCRISQERTQGGEERNRRRRAWEVNQTQKDFLILLIRLVPEEISKEDSKEDSERGFRES